MSQKVFSDIPDRSSPRPVAGNVCWWSVADRWWVICVSHHTTCGIRYTVQHQQQSANRLASHPPVSFFGSIFKSSTAWLLLYQKLIFDCFLVQSEEPLFYQLIQYVVRCLQREIITHSTLGQVNELYSVRIKKWLNSFFQYCLLRRSKRFSSSVERWTTNVVSDGQPVAQFPNVTVFSESNTHTQA